jgi:hypothetical protein
LRQHTAPETWLIWQEITSKYTIIIVIKHAHAWNWDRKLGRNLYYKHKQNHVHEHQCKAMEGKQFVKTCSIYHYMGRLIYAMPADLEPSDSRKQSYTVTLPI